MSLTHKLRVAAMTPGEHASLFELEARIQAGRGQVPLLYQVLLNSPPIASGWEQLLSAVRQQTTLAASLRELIILRVAVLNGAGYEFDAHVPFARSAGVSDPLIEATREPALSPLYDTDQRLVLELTDAMTREIVVSDALMTRLKARFDDHAVVEAVTTVAAYNRVSRFLVALQVWH